MVPIRFYIGLALALALGVGVALFGAHYRQLQNAAGQNEQRGAVIENTSAGIADGVEIDMERARLDALMASNRDDFQRAKTEAKRNEPETATRATRAVPDSVRAAFRERRLARERRGCTGDECRQDDQQSPASER